MRLGSAMRPFRGIGDVPNQLQVHSGAHHNDDDIQDLIGLNGLVTKDELTAPGAIQRPPQNGREGEKGQGHCNHQGHRPSG